MTYICSLYSKEVKNPMVCFVNRLFILLFYLFLIFCLSSCTFFKKKTDSNLEALEETEEYVADSGDTSEFVDEEEEDTYDDEEDAYGDAGEMVATSTNTNTENKIEWDTKDSSSDEWTSFSDVANTTPTKAWIPLKKIPQTSWMHDKKWINTVFIARQNDTLSSIQ